MNTEITDNEKENSLVFYDADCRMCVALARGFGRVLGSRGFALLPLQTPWVSRRLGLTEAQLLAEMRLLLPDGKIFGGADAVLEISRRFWWARPFYLFGRLPALTPLLRWAYGWIARHRRCSNGACEIVGLGGNAADDRGRVVVALLPLLVLPTLPLLFARRLEAWVSMWVMAFALYAGCKWLTYSIAKRRGVRTDWLHKFGYLLAWPGMNAAAFLSEDNRPAKPQAREWFFAMARTSLGAVLVWLVARIVSPVSLLLAGWVGMIGLILVLHFGVFHLLSLCWRSAGIKAEPLMRSPMLARSLSEFWGRRWNTAFHELANRFTFRPLRRVAGPTGATLLVFLVSGLIHELVISLPAHGGYGLPTGYFFIQGLGVIGEHTPVGRRMGLGRGWCGWLFTMLVIAGPVFWLFHPPFVHNVILPMLAAIGAT